MSRLNPFFLSGFFLFLGAGNAFAPQTPPAGTPDTRGDWVARQMEDRETAKDARVSMRMRLFDRQNRVRERAFTWMSRKGVKGAPTGDRTLVRFTSPSDINGTGFLVWKHPQTDDERFLYLPSLGRVRRIAGSETQESFVGSDFTYEDIGGRKLEDYRYMLLDDAASWTAPDGAKFPVYTLESRNRDAAARFPRVVSLVRRDNFIVVHAEIRNKRDEIQKTYDVRKLDKVQGYWTALELTMADALLKTRTELTTDKVEYNIGFTEDDFSRRQLERGSGTPLASAASTSAKREPRAKSRVSAWGWGPTRIK